LCNNRKAIALLKELAIHPRTITSKPASQKTEEAKKLDAFAMT